MKIQSQPAPTPPPPSSDQATMWTRPFLIRSGAILVVLPFLLGPALRYMAHRPVHLSNIGALAGFGLLAELALLTLLFGAATMIHPLRRRLELPDLFDGDEREREIAQRSAQFAFTTSVYLMIFLGTALMIVKAYRPEFSIEPEAMFFFGSAILAFYYGAVVFNSRRV